MDASLFCATRGYINAASLWCTGRVVFTQHNKVFKINAFYAEKYNCFIFL